MVVFCRSPVGFPNELKFDLLKLFLGAWFSKCRAQSRSRSGLRINKTRLRRGQFFFTDFLNSVIFFVFLNIFGFVTRLLPFNHIHVNGFYRLKCMSTLKNTYVSSFFETFGLHASKHEQTCVFFDFDIHFKR